MGVGGWRHATEKETRYPFCRRVGGRLRLVWTGTENLAPNRYLFSVSSFSIFVLHPFFFLSLDCPAFCLLSSLTTHTSMPQARLFLVCLLSLSLHFICTSLSWLFAFCPYCTTHTSMPPAWFEPLIPASERPQTFALNHSATGIGRFDPLTVEPAASHYTDYAIPALLPNQGQVLTAYQSTGCIFHGSLCQHCNR
jgi:hypothetical protein